MKSLIFAQNRFRLFFIRRHCRAPGSEGYHWRVRVDEKSNSSKSQDSPSFSWWDVQDENASLPIGCHTQSELGRFFSDGALGGDETGGSANTGGSVHGLSKFAKKLDAATSNVVHGRHYHGKDSGDAGPRIRVIAFKVLDLARTEHDWMERRQSSSVASRSGRVKRRSTSGRRRSTSSSGSRSSSRQPPSPPYTPPQTPPRSPYGGYTPPHTPPLLPAQEDVQQQQQFSQQQQCGNSWTSSSLQSTTRESCSNTRPVHTAAGKQQSTRDLLDFGTVGGDGNGGDAYLNVSAPAANAGTAQSNETRAQRLKREYEAKKQKQNTVWDEVDQRWVEVDVKDGSTVHHGNASVPPGAAVTAHSITPARKTVGIKLDGANIHGKSANVQAAVNKRVNDMKQSQAKASQEFRDREAKKKQNEAKEEVVRTKLEPKIKAWSEEHGKKKQLRALLSSLHTVLWEGVKWKPVSLGDVLDATKCKRCYHRATLVVHPDKTGSLNVEERFLAKRIFDALTQAKSEFDALN